MIVYIGSDHRGFGLKNALKDKLRAGGYSVEDCGNTKHDPADDYPDFTFAVADRVAAHPEARGIVVCGSGGGVVCAANKVSGIRAVLADTVDGVVHNRDHNDANMLGIGADYTREDAVYPMVTAFLETPFIPEERFVRRLKKIEARERR